MKHRIFRRFDIDAVNKWLTAIQSLAVIVGTLTVVIAWMEYVHNVRSSSEAFATQIQSQLDNPKFAQLQNVLEDSATTTPLLRRVDGGSRGMFSYELIGEYLYIYDTIGSYVKRGLIDSNTAYEYFSYTLERAWCNQDDQYVIQDQRSRDSTSTAKSDPYYGDFQDIALAFLARDHLTCATIESE